MSTQRKLYTEEFKRDAVRLAKERGNIAQTARDLGISDNWTSVESKDNRLRSPLSPRLVENLLHGKTAEEQ